MKYVLTRPQDGSPRPKIFEQADKTSNTVVKLRKGQKINLKNADESVEWNEGASPENQPHLEVWIQTKYIDFSTASGIDPEEFTDEKKADFVLSCAQQ